MNIAFIKPFLENLYPDNHENIIQILRKSFNGSEDTSIEGKEFQYLKFIFEIENDLTIDYTKYRYYKHAIFKEALDLKEIYDSKRTKEDEFFETLFYQNVIGKN